MKDPRPADVVIVQSKIIPRVLLLLCALLIVTTTIDFSFPLLFREAKRLTDFDDFYVVGKMFRDGSLERAYNYFTLIGAQTHYMGAREFLPWAYPPPFNFIPAGLARLPEGLAYLAFITLTFMSYIFVLKKLAKDYFGVVILAILPSLLITIKCGQNGFLTGSLVGLFCLLFLRSRAGAGAPLGLMVIKPHLAIGLGIISLIKKRWDVLAVGAAVVSFACLLATAIFGAHIWAAFLDGVKQSGLFLQHGQFPLFRMTSIYAVAMTFGFPPGIASFLQALVALAACGSIYYAHVKKWSLENTVGIAALSSLLISPYNYDYDLPILGVALALLMPGIMAHATLRQKAFLLGCSWLACGGGFIKIVKLHLMPPMFITDATDLGYSLGGIGMLVIFIMVIKILDERGSSSERQK